MVNCNLTFVLSIDIEKYYVLPFPSPKQMLWEKIGKERRTQYSCYEFIEILIHDTHFPGHLYIFHIKISCAYKLIYAHLSYLYLGSGSINRYVLSIWSGNLEKISGQTLWVAYKFWVAQNHPILQTHHLLRNIVYITVK